jgi:hypothetical protein
VLQAEVYPCLLIKGRRKFHLRTYVVVVEDLYSEQLLETFIYKRHEVRIAPVPVPENETTRDGKVHITNGSLSNQTERVLLSDVEELTSLGMVDKLELFVATCFGKDLVRDIAGRIRVSADESNGATCKFAVAGLDLMVSEDGRIYLLELNSNPAAPREENCTESFKKHLQGYLRDTISLVSGNPTPNFVSANLIMERNGVQF